MALSLFETLVAGSLVRGMTDSGDPPRLYNWRTVSEHEVEFVVETSDRVHGVECKWSASPDGSCISGLQRFPEALPPERRSTGWVVCTSPEESRIGPVSSPSGALRT